MVGGCNSVQECQTKSRKRGSFSQASCHFVPVAQLLGGAMLFCGWGMIVMMTTCWRPQNFAFLTYYMEKGELGDEISSFASASSSTQAPPTSSVGSSGSNDVIIAGSGNFRYQYDPQRLLPPPGASIINCHGFVLDQAGNIYLTYQSMQQENDDNMDDYYPKQKPNGDTEQYCMIRWNPQGNDGTFVPTGLDLCSGTPHGLTISEEHDENGDVVEYLYHANNDMKLTKTYLNGTIVWQRNGTLDDSGDAYRPTWFAVPPNERYILLCDGYGSNRIFLLDRTTGVYTNTSWGGPGTNHGRFHTNHGCVYDPLYKEIVVADRENHRLEYFTFTTVNSSNHDESSPSIDVSLEYSHTTDLSTSVLGNTTRPCILRRRRTRNVKDNDDNKDGLAVVADLTGTVAIVNGDNQVLSTIPVADLLGSLGHLHPHDAQLLPNGDVIIATWNPGRLSYWKRIESESAMLE